MKKNNNSKSKRLFIKVNNAFLRLKDWKDSYLYDFLHRRWTKPEKEKNPMLIVDKKNSINFVYSF